jgi:hypothetical protein
LKKPKRTELAEGQHCPALLLRGLLALRIRCLPGLFQKACPPTAGIVGGGVVGDLAIRFGYYRDQTDGMGIAVSARVILVQVVQSAGDFLARRADKKM